MDPLPHDSEMRMESEWNNGAIIVSRCCPDEQEMLSAIAEGVEGVYRVHQIPIDQDRDFQPKKKQRRIGSCPPMVASPIDAPLNLLLLS
ncbi:hypothetical protein N7468_001380 [Penicillium chermesinum]|uniref:Uncharacterized protein n=1 Tax=Penicillium chermesinum TaxID=63820 RepID=A0A9W9TX10_9EURO|nr:uncharacterized protein N7468_001380 [Penicillium chermesinum]KAJ5246397.1 hypothetical protein N7468_001380 [Penicillium chermesinum]